jgi:hypothetical protein
MRWPIEVGSAASHISVSAAAIAVAVEHDE